MRKNFLLAACAMVAMSMAAAGNVQAQSGNQITNGDFSNGLTGWTHAGAVYRGSASYYESHYSATGAPGLYPTFAVLRDSATASSLTVTFQTTAGTNYDLSFENGTFADVLEGTPEDLHYSVSMAGEGEVKSGYSFGGMDTAFDQGDLFSGVMTTVFTGNGGLATVTFDRAAGIVNDNAGAAILLTDVNVQNVPEPSSFALVLTGLVGIAGLGFARSRGRKSI